MDEEELRVEYGVQQVLCKPFSPRELISIANSLLEAAVSNGKVFDSQTGLMSDPSE